MSQRATHEVHLPDQALSLTTAGEAADDSSPQIVSFTVGCGLQD